MAAPQRADLWVPQRGDGGCPPLSDMRWDERLETVCFIGMLIVAGSHLVLIGPMALLPALAGTFGLLGILRGIRGLLVCANVAGGVFALLLLLVALVTVPSMGATCAHLDANRDRCYRCPARSTVEKCRGETDERVGPKCWQVATGSECMRRRGEVDECQQAAQRAQPPVDCYCVDDIWSPHWEVTCEDMDDADSYGSNIGSVCVGFSALFLVGSAAGLSVGCCNRKRFKRKVGSLSAARGAIAETFVSTPEPEASWQDGEPVTPVHVVDGVVDQSVGSGQGGPSGVMTGVVVHTEHAAAYTLGGVQGVTEPGADAESGAVVTAVAITASPVAPKPRPDDDDDVDVI